MEQQPRLVISPLDGPHGNHCLLRVAGDLEMSTAPQLRDTLVVELTGLAEIFAVG